MLPSSQELEYFIELVNSSNFTRASERLGITQPTLSMAIKRLEQNLGTELLIRSKSGVTLNKTGEIFFIKAKTLIGQWQDIVYEVESSKEKVIGKFTLGVHPSVGLFTLKYFLPKLLSDNPGLSIDLVHESSRNITEKIISHKINYAIVVNPIKHPDLVIIPLFKDVVKIFVHKNLLKTDVLIADFDLTQSQSILKKIKKGNEGFSRFMMSSNLEIIRDLVINKVGAGILPERVVGELKTKTLVALDETPIFSDQMCLIFRADVQKTMAHKEIVDSLRSNLKSN